MTKDIKDYLHLYLGCEYRLDWQEFDYSQVGGIYKLSPANLLDVARGQQEITLLLRPLSDMTEEEFREYRRAHPKTSRWGVVGKPDSGASDFDTWAAFEVQYLLSKGFDLYGLIEAGLAIDKTTLKQEA